MTLAGKPCTMYGWLRSAVAFPYVGQVSRAAETIHARGQTRDASSENHAMAKSMELTLCRNDYPQDEHEYSPLRYTRLWQILYYAGCSRKHACFCTDPGLERLLVCGLITEVGIDTTQHAGVRGFQVARTWSGVLDGGTHDFPKTICALLLSTLLFRTAVWFTLVSTSRSNLQSCFSEQGLHFYVPLVPERADI